MGTFDLRAHTDEEKFQFLARRAFTNMEDCKELFQKVAEIRRWMVDKKTDEDRDDEDYAAALEIDEIPGDAPLSKAKCLIASYQTSVRRILTLFNEDPLPADCDAHFLHERLEAMLDRGLLRRSGHVRFSGVDRT